MKKKNIPKLEFVPYTLMPHEEKKTCIMYCDGSAYPNNPGNLQIGVWMFDKEDPDDEIKFCKNVGRGDNNYAELVSIKYGIDLAIEKGFNNLEIYTDSRFCVFGLTLKWNLKDSKVRELLKEIFIKLKGIQFKIKWIPRIKNDIANGLSRACIA